MRIFGFKSIILNVGKKYLLKITSLYYFPPGWLQLYINLDIGLIYKVLAVPISFYQNCHYKLVVSGDDVQANLYAIEDATKESFG